MLGPACSRPPHSLSELFLGSGLGSPLTHISPAASRQPRTPELPQPTPSRMEGTFAPNTTRGSLTGRFYQDLPQTEPTQRHRCFLQAQLPESASAPLPLTSAPVLGPLSSPETGPGGQPREITLNQGAPPPTPNPATHTQAQCETSPDGDLGLSQDCSHATVQARAPLHVPDTQQR